MLGQSFLLAALATISAAAPFSPPTVVHEKRTSPFNGRTTRVHGDAVVPVRIGLTQSNLDKGYDYLMEVSHPSSAAYGKHWSVDKVNEIFAPSQDSVKAVKEWLMASGIDSESIATSRNQGWLAINIPAKQAESLFNTEYYEHENAEDGTVRLGCDSYELPKHLTEHVDFIKPGVTMSPPLAKKTVKRSSIVRNKKGAWKSSAPGRAQGHGYNSSTSLKNCGSNITPACIRALYDIPEQTSATFVDPANTLGIFESGDIYAQADIDSFFKKFAPNVPKGTKPIPAFIDGVTAPVSKNSFANTGESDIDLDMSFSLIFPQTVTLYQESELSETYNKTIQNDQSFITPFLDAIDGSFCTPLDRQFGFQCGIYELTRVVSMSYGAAELDPMQGSRIAQTRACDEIMKLALQGTTFVVSSGDFGVSAHPQGETNGCATKTEHGINANAVDGSIFSPSFPASCPAVLSVGATQLSAGETVNNTESVMKPGSSVIAPQGNGAIFSSSGGFSNFFETQGYQYDAVQSYFEAYDPGYPWYDAKTSKDIGADGGIYNRFGRAIPDVSANGAFFGAFNQGSQTQFFGTSLAAPLWASIITLINDQRSAQGKGPVGFVNAVLYDNPWALFDIVKGNNPGCNTEGFHAVPGWDPATGLGTPNFPALLELFLSLP